MVSGSSQSSPGSKEHLIDQRGEKEHQHEYNKGQEKNGAVPILEWSLAQDNRSYEKSCLRFSKTALGFAAFRKPGNYESSLVA